MKRSIAQLFFLVIFISFLSTVHGQQLAFPTAEGAGRFTSGGRGTPSVPTTVYYVTRLDDGADTDIGTFRWAVRSNSPSAAHRTVLFRVSGTIRLLTPLTIGRANTTIAGQTAPGDGICIADQPVSIGADNIIIRYIRFRLGDRYQAGKNPPGHDDALSALGRNNIIIDHCSISWSNDECLTVYRGDNTTLQWNMIYEPLDFSYHNEGNGVENHGYGGIWGGRKASFHHNLIAHIRGRGPRFDGSRNLPSSSAPVVGSENADFRNNVLYNWVLYNINGGEGGNYNVVNNYFKWGPNTPNTVTASVNRRSYVLNPYKQTTTPVLPYGKFFLEGNFVDSFPDVTANNWLGVVMQSGTRSDTAAAKVTTPFDISPVTTQTALQALELVLQGAGATLPKRDTLDERIANDVRNRTGRIIDMQGGYPRGTPFDQTLNAWPTLNSTPAPADSDNDGMPDAWETANGSNPNDASDGNVYAANGYTLLENYLNSITGPLPLTLLNFTATAINKEVAASWTTSNEINTKSFIVERGIDGRKFSAIGTVAARNTIQNNQYTFTDNNPVSGTSYYRLLMLDIDGKFTYSSVVKINRAGKIVLKVTPNPVTDRVVVTHPITSMPATIKVFSADGKQLTTVRVNSQATQTIINAAGYKAGSYYLVMENETEKSTISFIKK